MGMKNCNFSYKTPRQGCFSEFRARRPASALDIRKFKSMLLHILILSYQNRSKIHSGQHSFGRLEHALHTRQPRPPQRLLQIAFMRAKPGAKPWLQSVDNLHGKNAICAPTGMHKFINSPGKMASRAMEVSIVQKRRNSDSAQVFPENQHMLIHRNAHMISSPKAPCHSVDKFLDNLHRAIHN